MSLIACINVSIGSDIITSGPIPTADLPGHVKPEELPPHLRNTLQKKGPDKNHGNGTFLQPFSLFPKLIVVQAM